VYKTSCKKQFLFNNAYEKNSAIFFKNQKKNLKKLTIFFSRENLWQNIPFYLLRSKIMQKFTTKKNKEIKNYCPTNTEVAKTQSGY
jgi:hypothetical protein